MAITLNLPSVLAAHTGGARTIEATGRTLGEAVADVAARYPALAPRLRDKEGKPYPFVNFYLNDEDVRFRGGFAAPIQDGDEGGDLVWARERPQQHAGLRASVHDERHPFARQHPGDRETDARSRARYDGRLVS